MATADAQYKAGTDLTNSGISSLQDLDKQYRDLIASGGLTPELKRQFDMARGQVADQYTRSSRSLGAALASRRAQMGGALTPGAVAEMETQGNVLNSENAFGATNQVNMGEAQLGYESTTNLYNQIQNIRGTITQAGLTREQQAMLAKLQLASIQMSGHNTYVQSLLGML